MALASDSFDLANVRLVAPFPRRTVVAAENADGTPQPDAPSLDTPLSQAQLGRRVVLQLEELDDDESE